MTPPIPQNEKTRLEVLKSYHILDSIPEKEYDDLTMIASQICGVPISLISLIDEERQWFKSKHGITSEETEREHAFCAHAINYPDAVFTVEDSREDDRFKNNPLVTGEPHVVFYTGVPIVNDDGFALGTLCVIDSKPRTLSDDQKKALKALSNQVMQLIELRKHKIILEEKNHFLNQFAAVAAHDIKAPLNNINLVAEILIRDEDKTQTAESLKWLNMISESSHHLQSLVTRILSYSKNVEQIQTEWTTFHVQQCWEEVLSMCVYPDNAQIAIHTEMTQVYGHFTIWCQTIQNLIQNGIKYNHKNPVIVSCSISEDEEQYNIVIKDNGEGIPQENWQEIFEPFTILAAKDRFGKKGHGLGLSMVKKWLDMLDGNISIASEMGIGTTFTVTIPKQN